MAASVYAYSLLLGTQNRTETRKIITDVSPSNIRNLKIESWKFMEEMWNIFGVKK
jgi:hypothetical protein